MPADFCVIFNPTAGGHRAVRRMHSLRESLGSRAEFRPTQHAGHAEELARKAAGEGFPVVAASGGDGTVHEVANGILQARRPDVALGVFPVGSANDYAHTLNFAAEWWRQHPLSLASKPVDVGQVRTPEGRSRYFVNGLGLGFNGAVTMESRRIKWLQGQVLYTVALLKALWKHYHAPEMTVTLDGVSRQHQTLALSIALGRREGNFIVAPHAKLDDGLFDYLHAGNLSRWELIRHVPGMLTGNIPTDHPLLWLGRCRQARVQSSAPIPIHLDGELFALPADGVREVEITLLSGALRVHAFRGGNPETPKTSEREGP